MENMSDALLTFPALDIFSLPPASLFAWTTQIITMNDASVWQCIWAYVIAVNTAHRTSKRPVFSSVSGVTGGRWQRWLWSVRCTSASHQFTTRCWTWRDMDFGEMGEERESLLKILYVALVWLALANWLSAYTGTTQQIKLLINFTLVSNPTWTNETCPYSTSIQTPQELWLMFTQK